MTSHVNELHDDFVQFIKQTRTEVASAYVNGDAGPLERISTHADPATFFGPGGGLVRGARDVIAQNLEGAQSFDNDNDNQLEILHMSAGEDLGYWVGLQRVNARLKGKKERVPMALRVTEVFRREDDAWKLVHRHADMLVDAKK